MTNPKARTRRQLNRMIEEAEGLLQALRGTKENLTTDTTDLQKTRKRFVEDCMVSLHRVWLVQSRVLDRLHSVGAGRPA